MMHPLVRLVEKKSRKVVGLMSGTSLDGINAVVAAIEGTGRGLKSQLLSFVSLPYDPELRALILRNSVPETSSVLDLSQLNFRLAIAAAEAVRAAVAEAGHLLEEIDLVGSHGQTVHHVPDIAECAGREVRSTLQIGDPSVLANLLRLPVVGDFRPADMALGGQGAPLVPYFDFVHFASADENRCLLNLGGIGNLTVLPRGCGPDDVMAFDTGPGNMVIDQLAQHHFGLPFDEGGRLAAEGEADQEYLARVLDKNYFTKPPPKSTGRERFGAEFIEKTGLLEPWRSPHDALATATALTAYSVYQAYARFLRDEFPLDVVIVSGGGARNLTLMQYLANSFAPIAVKTADDFGLSAEAKEALCFAVLAHETFNGVATNLPRVTGAARGTVLGKICLPS